MVFETRKSIENASTYLAAENITSAEIIKIEEIIEIQENNYRMHKSITQNNLDFHNTIVRASRNKVLEILYYIISIFGQQSEIFEYLRKRQRPSMWCLTGKYWIP